MVEPYTVQTPKQEICKPVLDSTGSPVMEEKKTETQMIAQGPVASQAAIKMLGTNGGGFMNANAAHPYENPTPLANFIQMLSIFLIPSGLTWYLGRMVKNQRHGWAVWGAMAFLFLAGVLVCWWAEAREIPACSPGGRSGRREHGGEGGPLRDLRFRPFCRRDHRRLLRRRECHARFLHASGRARSPPQHAAGRGDLRGRGRGLYGMLVFVVLTVFLAGLMVGRTPEYLGKKIEAYDVKVSVLAVLILIFGILGFAAWAAASGWGMAGLNNNGPHGLTEILYAYSSASGNNGSAFAGLNANTPWYNMTLGFVMLSGGSS